MATHLSSPSLRTMRYDRLVIESEVALGRCAEQSAWNDAARRRQDAQSARALSLERNRLEAEAEGLRRSEERIWRKNGASTGPAELVTRPRTAEAQWIEYSEQRRRKPSGAAELVAAGGPGEEPQVLSLHCAAPANVAEPASRPQPMRAMRITHGSLEAALRMREAEIDFQRRMQRRASGKMRPASPRPSSAPRSPSTNERTRTRPATANGPTDCAQPSYSGAFPAFHAAAGRSREAPTATASRSAGALSLCVVGSPSPRHITARAKRIP
mmetsp:Transcript_8924/g.19910  ORF Transcript_8924/g.19910 Transcript_8924/m.19910 type:complete len:270 (-) Transcript_8924:387-1196(-)